MKFSIIVPTYNEQDDIVGTLEALVALDYADKEILIVDDSTDATPEIVLRYESAGVRLIRPGGGGRCEARNKGILEASGDVVCILNADVRPRADFLRRLVPHYEDGADYVLVLSKVSNDEHLFARYVECVGALDYKDPSWMEWTEGFSCRRAMAVAAGMFPVGFALPLCAGEDGYFGERLRALGANKHIDLSIVVDHVAPASFGEYWRIRKGRGIGSAQAHRFLDGWTIQRIVLWNLLKSLRTIVYTATLLPVFSLCFKAIRLSRYGERDFFPFLYAWFIEQLAFHSGEWESTWQLMKVGKRETVGT